jgi:hypothetical protein
VRDTATLIADARRALAEYQSKAWHKTVLTTPEDEALVTAALDDLEGIRIKSSPHVQPGQVLILNDDAADAALELSLQGEVYFTRQHPNPEWTAMLTQRVAEGSSKIINVGLGS